MSDKIPWPKKGDNPFEGIEGGYRSPTWCSLEWFRNFDINDSRYAEAFKKSGDKIINELKNSEDRRHPDFYFMPVAFLYRHCLELKLKHLILLSIDLELIEEDDKLKDILKEHSLYPLWNATKAGLVKFWPKGPKEDLNAVEGVIREFHNIDKGGQSLRYSESKSGNRNADCYPNSVELRHMMVVVDRTFSLLDGCEMGYDNAIETRNEMRYEMQKNYGDY